MQYSTILDWGIHRADGADNVRQASIIGIPLSYHYGYGDRSYRSVDVRNDSRDGGVYSADTPATVFHANRAMDAYTYTPSEAKETETKVTTASNSSNQENRRGD